MIAMVAATFVWTLGFFIGANSNTLRRQLLFNNVGYIGSVSVPVCWFVFSLQYAAGKRQITLPRILLLCVVPAVTIALVWSNNWHHLMWSGEHLTVSGSFTVTSKTYGPFFWVAFGYNYTLVFSGCIILLRRLSKTSPLRTGQVISTVTAVILPLTWNAIYVFRLFSLPRMDLTPAMFALSGVVIVLGLMRFRLFAVAPFARRFLFQQLSDCILVFDAKNHLLEANPAALALFGVGKSIIGQSAGKLPLLSSALKQLSPDTLSRVELPLTASGAKRFYELVRVPMRDNQQQPLGWLVILRDINKRRLAEEALNDSQVQLRHLVEDLSHQNELRTEFLRSVAHELKTPLTAIASSSELLTAGNIGQINLEQRQQLLDNINRSAWMMNAKVSELVDFASLQTGRVELNLEPLDLREIIDEITTQFSPLFQSKQQSLQMMISDALPMVKGDRKRTMSVIFNLISNANKFTPVGGSIDVFVFKHNRMVRVEIKDTAPVVAETERARIFAPYSRVVLIDERGQDLGLGIGLATSKGLITLMGGEIGVVSKEGQGNIFYFTLPAWTAS